MIAVLREIVQVGGVHCPHSSIEGNLCYLTEKNFRCVVMPRKSQWRNGYGVGVTWTAAPTQVKSRLSLAAPADTQIGCP